MYRRCSRNNNTSFTPPRRNSRAVSGVLIALLLVAVFAVSILYAGASAFRSDAQNQFERYVLSAVVDAIEQVNRLTSGVQSDSASKLAQVRQNVFLMDRLNNINIFLLGERGRLVPQEALTVLYEDLDTYEKLLQTATSPTLEIRTTLLTHLTALHELIRE